MSERTGSLETESRGRAFLHGAKAAWMATRKLDLNAFSGKIVGVKIKHTRRSPGKLMVREKVARL
jgi:hypothetical protein